MRYLDHRQAFPLALIAITSLAAAAACGSSPSNPAAHAAATTPPTTHAVTAAPQTFTSQRYSFRVVLTKHWSEHDAVVDWNGKKLQGLDSAAFANFTDLTTHRTLVTGAAPIAQRIGLAQWRAAIVRAAPSVCSESASADATTLGGEPALTWTATCSDGYIVNKLAVLHAARGYVILLASPTGHNRTENRRAFESVRRSFHFTR
jgi:hypothetical protein